MKHWTVKNFEDAARQGWILNTEWHEGYYMIGIERVDDPPAWENPPLPFDKPQFESDDGALLFVLQQASTGDALALKALECIHEADERRFKRCKGCTYMEPRQKEGFFTRIAPMLGYCTDCITKAARLP